jgi:hypothetical protein
MIMNNITNFIRRILGMKPKKTVTVNINQSTVDTLEKYHGVDIKNEFENVLRGEFKSDDLNQITLKMNVFDDRPVVTDEKPKKKRYYKKKPKTQTTEVTLTPVPKKVVNKTHKKTEPNDSPKTEVVAKKTNTTKKKYRGKKPKQVTPTQHQ